MEAIGDPPRPVKGLVVQDWRAITFSVSLREEGLCPAQCLPHPSPGKCRSGESCVCLSAAMWGMVIVQGTWEREETSRRWADLLQEGVHVEAEGLKSLPPIPILWTDPCCSPEGGLCTAPIAASSTQGV